MIVGVGVDVCPVDRFHESLMRTPKLGERLFTEAEMRTPSGGVRGPASLAARFAAKEALAKALGAPGNLHWHDAEVITVEHGAPRFLVRGTVQARAEELGVQSFQLSLSHDGGLAVAMVIALGIPS